MSDASVHSCPCSMAIMMESILDGGIQRCQECSCGKLRLKWVRMPGSGRWSRWEASSLSSSGDGRCFALLIVGRDVVSFGQDGVFPDIKVLGCNLMVEEAACKLKI